jgi:hypothetical protein
MPDDSEVRSTATKIIAFRLGGMLDEDICTHLGITKSTLKLYIYRAGKNGWLDYNTSREAIEYGLDDESRNEKTGLKVKDLIALKVLEGTSFKEFESDTAPLALPAAMVSIRIEQPSSPVPMRQGTIGGSVIDVEPVVKEG